MAGSESSIFLHSHSALVGPYPCVLVPLDSEKLDLADIFHTYIFYVYNVYVYAVSAYIILYVGWFVPLHYKDKCNIHPRCHVYLYVIRLHVHMQYT